MVMEEQRKDRDGGAKQLSIICQGGGGAGKGREADSYPCFRSKYIPYSVSVKADGGIGRRMP